MVKINSHKVLDLLKKVKFHKLFKLANDTVCSFKIKNILVCVTKKNIQNGNRVTL